MTSSLPVEPLCVVPAADDATASMLVGVNAHGELVEIRRLPFAYAQSVFVVAADGTVAIAHGSPRATITVVDGDGKRRSCSPQVEAHPPIVCLEIAAGRLFFAKSRALFSLPLADLDAQPTRCDAPSPNRVITAMFRDGDRLLVAEEQYKSGGSLLVFDLRDGATACHRRVDVSFMLRNASIGGAFVVAGGPHDLTEVVYQHVQLHDRHSLMPVADSFRVQNARWNTVDTPPPQSPGWPGAAAVLEDTLVVAEANGGVLSMRVDALMERKNIELPEVAHRHIAPFDGAVVERFVPVPYQRAAVVIVREHGTQGERLRALLWSP